MTSIRPIAPGFQEGEAVVLAKGTYQGTRGVFLHLTKDTNWAQIEESDRRIRNHPWPGSTRSGWLPDRAPTLAAGDILVDVGTHLQVADDAE